MNAQPLQRTDEWQEQRTGRITGSRVGAILGLSKYRTRGDVMRDMVRQFHHAEPEFTGNDATRYGETHEADAIESYEQRYAVLVEPSGLVVHPEYDWLAASPDGLVGDDGMAEFKCPYRAKYKTPSPEYRAQMQLQMACADRAWCDFCIWRAGEPIIVERVQRDPDWLTDNLPALRAFIEEFNKIIARDELSAPYLADKDRDDDEWRGRVAEWLDAKRHADEAIEWEKRARAALIDAAPGGAKGCGVQVVKVERAGSIRYAEALKTMLPDVDLSPWRGKPSVSYQVRESKE